MTVDLSRQLACALREVAMRRSVYPRWTAAHRMGETKAKEELEAMEAIARTLAWLQESEPDIRAFVTERKAAREAALQDPVAQSVMEAFPGSEVIVR